MKKSVIIALWASLGSLWVSSCSQDPEPTPAPPNRSPGSFTVSATQSPNGTDVLLNWTRSKDPEGDLVTYSVVFTDTLVNRLIDTTFVLQNVVDYNRVVAGRVTATDPQKASTTASFSITTGNDLYVPIPDAMFERKLISLKLDDKLDGKLLRASAQTVTRLDVSGSRSQTSVAKPIYSLAGIEAFTNLISLDCGYNAIGSLDLSQNIQLTTLSCSSNGFSSLDLSKNVNLVSLTCTNLVSLDISKNRKLQSLSCLDGFLKNLDLSQLTALTRIDCYNNLLTQLDLSKCTALTWIDCTNNQLATLRLPQTETLKLVHCKYNQLKVLDLTSTSSITELTCTGNQLTALDLSRQQNLGYLECSANTLTSLDLRASTNLRYMYCRNNPIQIICVTDISAIPSGWTKDVSATYQTCR